MPKCRFLVGDIIRVVRGTSQGWSLPIAYRITKIDSAFYMGGKLSVVALDGRAKCMMPGADRWVVGDHCELDVFLMAARRRFSVPKFEVGDIVVFTAEMLGKSKIARDWSSQGPLAIKRIYEDGNTISVTRLDGNPFTVSGWSHTIDVAFGANYFRLDVFLNEARKAITNAK